MFDVRAILWLIPVLPLLAAVLVASTGPRWLKRHSHWPCIAALLVSFVLSAIVFTSVRQGVEANPLLEDSPTVDVQSIQVYYPWIQVGDVGSKKAVDIGFSLRADALSTMMLVMITFIGTLIAIYSIGYMHDDPGYPRFFACISLFIFSMTTLVLADNFVLLYAGWEGVGLCSYLLVGFWFTKPAAANAARKAFLVTRIGDIGLLLGILLLWTKFGYDLSYENIFAQCGNGDYNVYFACLLIFCGAVGKSAQFPLHVWLPDAMEGPTPVSALIHAATMVTAGVYLLARCTPMFAAAPEAQLLVAVVGGITALMAAFIALTQTDLKRVLAYSTLSQLGYMFLALGCANANAGLATFAVTAALFHLFTHAFFKALLFLSAGSVMHAMGGVIDMRRFGGLRQVMPKTHWTFLCGALALSGFPLFSGFWSKDEILAVAYDASAKVPAYSTIYLMLFVVGLVAAGMTAFYTFRAYFLTFHGDLVVPPEAGSHGHDAHAHAPSEHADQEQGQAHESPATMTIPLIVLAVFALGVGAALGPTHLFAGYLQRTPGFPSMDEPKFHWTLMGISSAVALGGVALAWLMYGKPSKLPERIAKIVPGLYRMSYNKMHIDELYQAFLIMPMRWLWGAVRAIDSHLVDGFVDLVGQVPRLVGVLFRPVQNGLVQFYALAMVLALTVFLVALVRAL